MAVTLGERRAGVERGARGRARSGGQFPALAVFAAQEWIGGAGVGHARVRGVPLEPAAGAERDVAEVVGFGEPAGVFEVRQGAALALAGVDPLLVMAGGLGKLLRRTGEAREVLLGQKQVLSVVGEQHAFFPNEQRAVAPLRDAALFPDFRALVALMPGHPHWRQVAAGAEFVDRAHGGGRDLGMGRRTEGLDGEWRLQLQRPERQVVPVRSEVAHGAVAEIPPAVPFRSREVDLIVGPVRCSADPQVPVQSLRNRHFHRTLVNRLTH